MGGGCGVSWAWPKIQRPLWETPGPHRNLILQQRKTRERAQEKREEEGRQKENLAPLSLSRLFLWKAASILVLAKNQFCRQILSVFFLNPSTKPKNNSSLEDCVPLFLKARPILHERLDRGPQHPSFL